MTGLADSAWVEQAVFGNQGGMRILASSVSDSAVSGRWEVLLERFVRIESVPGVVLPRSALSYFVLSDHEVAVLYRWRDEDSSPGRNPSRMLVGPPNVLSVPVALGLSQWPQWTRYVAGQQLQPFAAGEVVQAGQLGFDRLSAQALHLGSTSLERLLAPLIDSPTRKLSVLGCPPEGCAAAMLALHEIGDRYLWKRFQTRWDWSFSTYEVEHAGRAMPDVVFLPARPSGADPTSRSVVDLQTPTNASADAVAQARMLVQRFLSGDRSELEVVSTRRPASLDDDRAVFPTAPVEDELRAPGSAASEGKAQQHAVSRTGSQPAGAPGPQPVRSDVSWLNGDGDDPLGEVLGSADADMLRDRLHDMVTRSADSSWRTGLRHAVPPGRVDEVVQVINYRAPLRDQAKSYDTVISFLFGSELEDLQQVQGADYAAKIVNESLHDRFVDRLIDRSVRFPNCHAALVAQLSQRYLVAHGLARPTGPAGRSLPISVTSRWGRLRWPALSVVAGVAVVLFVVGYLTGVLSEWNRDAAVAIAGPSAVVTAEPPPLGQEPDARQSLPLITVPADSVKEGQSVYVMVEDRAGKLQFAGECRLSGSFAEWGCPAVPYPVLAQKQGLRPILVVSASGEAAQLSVRSGNMVRAELAGMKISLLAAFGG